MKKWLFVLLLPVILLGCTEPPKQVYVTGPTMGTTYNIKYIAPEEMSTSSKDIHTEIDRLLEEVNDQMSTYRVNSELSLFNQYKSDEPFKVSKDTAFVVKEAIRLNGLTKGALDVTVGPLVNLWGFGPDAKPEIIPSAESISLARQATGIEHIKVDGNLLVKTLPKLYVDLSPIAKGWGVDVIANYLEMIGIDNYLVEVGGEIRLKGVNSEGAKWRIAIEKPVIDERSVQLIIAPGDMAIATSGDYRNYFEQDGVRYSHIINPQTGKPINHKVVSITVLSETSMEADGLATGLMVLGHKAALDVAEANDIAIFIIEKTDEGFAEYSSSHFKPYLKQTKN
ncbi:FAD:protein FMN transferase [Vibrio sp.]|nr:FAD:protein FMN transferase [Vibrio sp.]